jgi:hypothetical protein
MEESPPEADFIEGDWKDAREEGERTGESIPDTILKPENKDGSIFIPS